MTTGGLQITLRANAMLATAWVNLVRLVVPFVGLDRALRWALYGARRLIFVKIDKGPWQRMRLDDDPECDHRDSYGSAIFPDGICILCEREVR